MFDFIKKRKNNIEKKIILVVGGMGDFGKQVVLKLEKKGYKTVIVDNLDNACLSTYRELGKILGYKPDFYELDLRDIDGLEEVFKKYKVYGVINFACLGNNQDDNKYIPGNLNLILLKQKYNIDDIKIGLF